MPATAISIGLPLVLFALPLISLADDDPHFCLNLPHSDYLSADDLKRACHHRAQWISDRDSAETRFRATDVQRTYLDSLAALRRREVLSPKWKWPKKNPSLRWDAFKRMKRQEMKQTGLKKFVRKEYRLMSDAEREDLHTALNILKTKRIDNITIWDLHILIHYPNSAPAAHWGPAFLPWHREFLRQFEAALHNEVPSLVGIPYWDSTLDHGLPDPADSVMWSEQLMGNGNGFVRTGPFKDWDTNVLMPLSPVAIKRLYRSTGARSGDRLLSPEDAEWIVSRRNFSELTFCHDKTFESMHGLSHVWVGGFMFVIRVSPNDPTFYFHHAFIDHLWEQFRERAQSRRQRETDYAEKVCNKQHAFDAQMKPFKLQNGDGLSNDYTDFWFEYQSVRHCSPEAPYCDSKFLFCDKAAWRCRSRVVLGGNCTGFAGTDICFESLCIQSLCRLPATEGNGFVRRERRPSGVVWTKTLLLTDDRPLSSGIAHVSVRDDASGGEETTAFVQRSPQYPEMAGLVYLPLPNPRDSVPGLNVTLDARDHYGRYCQSYCMNATTAKYQVCEWRLTLRSRLTPAQGEWLPLASNVSFTHQFTARKFLDMDMSVHPKQWKVYPPFVVFSCQRKLLNSAAVSDLAAKLVPPLEGSEYVWFRVSLLRKFRSTTELEELHIEAEDTADPKELFISAVRRARSAYDQSVVFVRARSPWLYEQGTTVRVSVRQNGVRIDCDVQCNREDSVLDNHCPPTVRLHKEPDLSQEQVFSSDPTHLPYLGWRMIGHPSEWRLRMPYLSLYC